MVHILMAVYNGESYLEEQLSSIGEQTYTEWVLHVRDDGSTDGTVDIINSFAGKHPGKVKLYEDKEGGSHGAKGNFGILFRSVNEPGDYAFCDQDDIWHADKLMVCVKELRRREKNGKNGVISPALVYSDAELVDESGKVTENSFLEVSKLYMPDNRLFEHLLLYNFAQGASMVWNEQLHDTVSDIPDEAVMHDWWVALVAAGCGVIGYIPKTLISYRQHSGNVLGDFNRKEWRKSFADKIGIRRWAEMAGNNRDLKIERYEQAKAYADRFGDKRAMRYIRLMECGRFYRTVAAIREGYIFLSKPYSIKYYILN